MYSLFVFKARLTLQLVAVSLPHSSSKGSNEGPSPDDDTFTVKDNRQPCFLCWRPNQSEATPLRDSWQLSSVRGIQGQTAL